MARSQTTSAGRSKHTEERSRKHHKHPPGKHRAEMDLIDHAFAFVPKSQRVLDVPCGGGRVTIHLTHRGYQMTAADLAKSRVQAAVDQQDVERLTYPDKAFDTIVSFRLFHHFPSPDIRRRAVAELCRVARRTVVLSYFSPYSFTSVKNKLRERFGGQPAKKYPTSLTEVSGYFRAHSFRLTKDFAQLPLVHTLHAAVFQRDEAAP